MNASPAVESAVQPDQATGTGESCDRSNHAWSLVFLFLIAGGSAGGLYVYHLHYPAEIDFKFHLPLFLFAILGVVFHIAAKYREMREEGGFSFGKYWFDHAFRTFQACLYVLIIDNWENNSGLTTNMAVVALLMGMYVRKVEVAFESLGDRIGDMLKSVLGQTSQQMSAEERSERAKALRADLDNLQQRFLAQAGAPGQISEDARRDFRAALDFIHKGCPDEAEKTLLELGFRLKATPPQDNAAT